MVYFDIVLHVISENLSTLTISPELIWYFNIECSYCKEAHNNEIYFTLADEHEMQKGHSTANFIMSCKNCDKGMSISFYEKSKLSLDLESGNDTDVVATFDCRGCELTTWIPREGISLKSANSDKIFDDVDIKEVWCDFDEVAGTTCSLLEPVEVHIERNKNL